jgi:hypothetical protein
MQQFFGVVIRHVDFQEILRRSTPAACGFQTRPCFFTRLMRGYNVPPRVSVARFVADG